MKMNALRQAIERIAEGTPLRDEAEAEMNIILRLVKDAQIQLRSTQINWQDDCLFKCDAALTELVTQLEAIEKKYPQDEWKLRKLWTSQGVPVEKQDRLIAEIDAKAQPGARVGPWVIGE